jgi:membrane peptidoglycan carboxypeptidase
VNNGSLVAIRPQTGEILAMVGSYDYYNRAIDGQVNVATALRQPGSSFKPFTYATAFGSRKWAPSSTVVDQPISRPDVGSKTGVYRPVNYDGKFHGVVSLRSALANSYNIPAVLVQEAVGTKEVIKTARTMGIQTELPEVMSLTLGAGVVRLLDMTSAYGVFANGGVRVEPTPFLKITDSQGHVVYDLNQPKGEQVIAPEVAYEIADVLSDNAARRAMFGNVLDLAGGRVGAVKTGTTNDYKDSWTIGFTPSLVTGVWVGNTDNSEMLQVAGSLGAGYIWKDFMDRSLQGQPIERFVQPPGVTRMRVCGVTDLLLAGSTPSCSLGPAGSATSSNSQSGRVQQVPVPTIPPRPTAALPPR